MFESGPKGADGVGRDSMHLGQGSLDLSIAKEKQGLLGFHDGYDLYRNFEI